MIVLFLHFKTQLGHSCAAYYRLIPAEERDRPQFVLEEMNVSAPLHAPHGVADKLDQLSRDGAFSCTATPPDATCSAAIMASCCSIHPGR